ncbi:hypothetical protein ZOSMA_47G00520 [Zostera marina]|uniref:Uncharacterized protein n=1 Tax=Zostera marina TaxID=29655 RepID=A0A0K9NZM2_ZOSMR|nr:hypothetical protein ZOSMA_47G00520 [Zostera marina]
MEAEDALKERLSLVEGLKIQKELLVLVSTAREKQYFPIL